MRIHTLFALAATFMIACGPASSDQASSDQASSDQASSASESTERARSTQVAGGPSVAADLVVYKSPTCGCCNGWIEHMREAGHTVQAVDVPRYAELQSLKRERGVPGDLGSCHTAVLEGYTLEGHVPAEVVERLLRERPDIKGLAVPNMPIGSPGMEGPNPRPYQVIAFTDDGERSVFETVEPTQPNSDSR